MEVGEWVVPKGEAYAPVNPPVANGVGSHATTPNLVRADASVRLPGASADQKDGDLAVGPTLTRSKKRKGVRFSGDTIREPNTLEE